ncbi:MAG: hypothetical protein Q4A52_05605, partial [Bacillota bacterium]|nr:hypothetical protein [Bacillota bacterium]
LNAFGELDEGALTVLQNQLETVRDQRDRVKRELTEIEVRFQQFQIDPDLHAHIRSLEEEDLQLEVDGKRLELFRALVTEAEEEYRRANQPEFIRQVGIYLDRITGGKYQTVYLEDERHIVIRNEMGSIVDAEKHLSLGTIQQIAFCLRLSLLDLVDREKRLPLLIDDAFAHWDEERQRRGFELLASDLIGRQIFYATPSRATSRMVAQQFAAPTSKDFSFNQILIES